MLKELSLSRAHLEELYEKYKTGPNEFKKVIPPPQTLLLTGPRPVGIGLFSFCDTNAFKLLDAVFL
jgi:hypothetical protein